MKRKIFHVLFALMLAFSLGMVLTTPAAAATITVGASGADYTTIQAAIDAASPGDVISVAAGAYTEDLTVSTGNLTLMSASGAAATTIQLVDAVGIDIQAGADSFTLGGSTGHGFTILSGAGTSFEVQVTNAPSDVTISYNTVNTTGNASQGISVGAAGASGLTISGNTFVAELGDGSVWGPKMVNVTVTGNTMTGPGASPASGYAVEFAGVTGTSTISNNTISNYSQGVAIFNGEGTAGLTISNNTVTGCTKGIRLGQYSPATDGDMTTVTVTQNTLSTNTNGIYIESGANVLADQFTILYNNISGNTAYGLYNATGLTVTATNNWWGNASGPVPNAPVLYTSYGDTEHAAVYNPWLLAPTGGVTPTTYEKTLALKDGWTLVSTDKEVTTGTAWAGTNILSGTATVLAYQYTAGSGYTQVTLASQLTSVDAFYVKTDGGGGVGINYSTAAPGVVTKSLAAGWNVISCAGETDAYALLSQLRYATIGTQQGVGLTSLAGQGDYNQFSASIYETLVTDAEWIAISPAGSPVTLSPYDGYWVYLNAAKTFGVLPDSGVPPPPV